MRKIQNFEKKIVKLTNFKLLDLQKKEISYKKISDFGEILFYLTITVILFLSYFKSVCGSPLHESEIERFDLSLKIAAKNISNRVLKTERKILITVIDFLDIETQARGAIGDLIEEQFTELLYEIIPEQVIPYFEIVSLRLEWESRFPEIKHQQLSKKILKLTGADWLVTGNFENKHGTFHLSLKLCFFA